MDACDCQRAMQCNAIHAVLYRNSIDAQLANSDESIDLLVPDLCKRKSRLTLLRASVASCVCVAVRQ